MRRPHVAVFAGPGATILNTPPLVTSSKARPCASVALAGEGVDDHQVVDVLRPQRLAAPVTVYVEQFSAHPLEADAAHLYGPPDGYVDESGAFSSTRTAETDRAVYAITLHPSDGLFPLPYVAVQSDGRPWEHAGLADDADAESTRQTWFPDAARLFEEVDRFGIDRRTGRGGLLSSLATFEFLRAAPSGGYASGDPGERRGHDFYSYAPWHLRADPPLAALARITNEVITLVRRRGHDAVLWLEGSPTIEETLYWLHLVIDTDRPLVGVSAQHAHGALGSDGPRNLVKALQYISSRVWADERGADIVGAVLVVDDRIYGARDVQKQDARSGGYGTTGGLGGPLGAVPDRAPVDLFVRPNRRSTHTSAVRLSELEPVVMGVRLVDGTPTSIPVTVKDESGHLVASALPDIGLVKYGSYRSTVDDGFAGPEEEIEVLARLERALRDRPLSGFVCEGLAPYGIADRGLDAALRISVFSGMPVVKVGRGNAGGPVPTEGDVFVLGSNLTATKARMLLMATMLRLGALSPARDPHHPTRDEQARVRAELAAYQEIFDTH